MVRILNLLPVITDSLLLDLQHLISVILSSCSAFHKALSFWHLLLVPALTPLPITRTQYLTFRPSSKPGSGTVILMLRGV